MEPWVIPWEPGASTGVGPLPGDDPWEAARVAIGEAPALPFLPELPERGVGADDVGRTLALLVGMNADVTAGRWRLVPRPSGDHRRARELLERDLDALEEAGGGHAGPVKLAVVGPWTLAARIELEKGDKALGDRGATRELAESLAEGVSLHVAEVRRRLSRATRVVVEVDETLLPAVLAGVLPTASGWGRLPRPEPAPAGELLGSVLEAAGGDAGVRCDVARPPLDLLRQAGARFVSFDGAHLESVAEQELGEAIEAGAGIVLGLVPAPAFARPVADLAAPARRVWERLGFTDRHWAGVVVTHSADLTDLSMANAMRVLRRCRDVATSLLPDRDGPPPGDDELS